jgi:polyhydroxyalkanoate synthesis regulator phasin
VLSKLASGAIKFKSNNQRYDELVNQLSTGCELRYADGNTSSTSGRIQFIYQDGLQEIARDAQKRNKFIEDTLSNLADIRTLKERIATYQHKKHDNIVNYVSQLRSLDQKISEQQSKINAQQGIKTLTSNIDSLSQKVKDLQKESQGID